MLKLIFRSLIATLLLAAILCGAYPLAVTAVGQLLFREKANGGMIHLKDGRIVGAKLIGQPFTQAKYFHGRPSAAGSAPSAPNGYDAANSSGSNLGPTNQKFADGLKSNIDAVLKENLALKPGEVPVDLVTASGSGLDPHISPAAAAAQIDRVAQARKMSVDEVKRLVEARIEGPQWGVFGESVVNVLLLNLDLDQQAPVAAK
ncbi:MAG: potassium-transporting ATPase subunit KdpC [Oligoflexia bacterium]|nr:potassium-transporting ATPase subunit KdpC [Oligoflexia bacterium]